MDRFPSLPRALVLASLTSLAACAGSPAEAPGARVAVNVAPLSLSGITDATYTLRVLNGADTLVWERQVTSTAYGDGAGSLAYVGPCDADPAAARNRVQLVLDALVDANGTLVAGVDYINPAPSSAPLERSIDCTPNADTPVTFDITFARAAQQGFFDVAVQFEDLFCSAKFDCQDADGDPLRLLFDDTGARAETAVFAFACTGGDGSDTRLYLSDLTLACGAGDTVTVNPALGVGLLSRVPGSGLPNAHLFDAMVTQGTELLGTYQKRYWNVALGLEDVAGCTFSATGTASDGALSGGATPADSVWPYLAWSVPMDSCTRHALNAADGRVATRYTGFGGETFPHAMNAPELPFLGTGDAATPLHYGTGVPTPSSCAGYLTPPVGYVRTTPLANGFYTVDPLADGSTASAYCDMTTDGGGWTRVFAHVNGAGQDNPIAQLTTLQDGLTAAATGNGHPRPDLLRPWYVAGGFSSLRFECQKAVVPRKVHLVTATPAVLDYFTGQGTGFPDSIGTIARMPDDTSSLTGYTTLPCYDNPALQCGGPELWGRVSGTYFTHTWGHEGIATAARFYDHAFFIKADAHWLLSSTRDECDDYDASSANHEGFWYVWAR